MSKLLNIRYIKKIIQILVWGLVVFSLGCRTNSLRHTESLKQTFEYKNQALITGDKQQLLSVIHPKMHYVHSNCWDEDAMSILDDSTNTKLDYLEIKVDDMSFEVFDNTGIVRGNGLFKLIYNNKPLDISLCFTEIYLRQQGKWKLISRHGAKLQN